MLFKDPADRCDMPLRLLLESCQNVLSIVTHTRGSSHDALKPVYNMWKQVATIIQQGVHTKYEQNITMDVTW